MSNKEIIVRLIVTENVEDWGGGDVSRTYDLDDFELVSTDIPEEEWSGLGEQWAQDDGYYETVQNLVAIFDD